MNKWSSSSPSEKNSLTEKLYFSFFRFLTYLVVLSGLFIFGDIIIKGSGKVLDHKTILNWEFIFGSPQTLHVITIDGQQHELSSDEYFAHKDKKVLEAWSNLKSQGLSIHNGKNFLDLSKEYKQFLDANDWSNDFNSFVTKEKQKVSQKFTFWKSLIQNPALTAEQYSIAEDQVPKMVSRFVTTNLDALKLRYWGIEEEIVDFQAKYWEKIRFLNLDTLSILEENFNPLLSQNLPSLQTEYFTKKDALVAELEIFLQNPDPKSFIKLSQSFFYFNKDSEIFSVNNTHTILSLEFANALRWVNGKLDIDLSSDDYAHCAGGIFPAIIGTILLVLGAMIIATILGIGCAIFLSEYAKANKFTSIIRLSILNLAGVPSIIFGLFGFGMFVLFLDWNVSLIAGCFTLAFMVLPIVINSCEEALSSIPNVLRQSAFSLGATKWQMIRTVILPFALPGMLTSSILGVARAAGETAPIMFTAAFAIKSELPWENLESWGDFFFQGVMALPYHIYILSKIPQNEYSIGTQYGTAFVFLILILILTSLSMIFRFRMRNKQKIFQS